MSYFNVQPVFVVVWLSIGFIAAKPTVTSGQPFQDLHAESRSAPGLNGANASGYFRVTGLHAGRENGPTPQALHRSSPVARRHGLPQAPLLQKRANRLYTGPGGRRLTAEPGPVTGLHCGHEMPRLSYASRQACRNGFLKGDILCVTRHFPSACESLAHGGRTESGLRSGIAAPMPREAGIRTLPISLSLTTRPALSPRLGRVAAKTPERADFELVKWDVALSAAIPEGRALTRTGQAAGTKEGRSQRGYGFAIGAMPEQAESGPAWTRIQFSAPRSLACECNRSVCARMGEDGEGSSALAAECQGHGQWKESCRIETPGLNLVRPAPLRFLAEKTAAALPGLCIEHYHGPDRRDCCRQFSTTNSNSGGRMPELSSSGATSAAVTGFGRVASASGLVWAEPVGILPGLAPFPALRHTHALTENGAIDVSVNRLRASDSEVISESGDAPVGPEELAALDVECDDIADSVYAGSDELQLSCRATGATGENPNYQWAWTARGSTTDTEHLSATDIPNPVFLPPKFLPIPGRAVSFTYEYTAAAAVAGEGSASADVDITVLVTDGFVNVLCSSTSALVYEGMPDIKIGCGWFSNTDLGEFPPASFDWEWSARAPTTSVDELSDPHIQRPTFNVPESVEEDTEYSYTITVSYPRWNGDEEDFTVTVKDRVVELIVFPTELEIEEGDTDGETYAVALKSPPTGDVTVTVSGHADTDVSVSPSNLTFRTDNWSFVQTVTVTAVHDDDTDNDSVTLTNTASGGGFGGADAVDVDVTVIDDDEDLKEIVATPTALDVDEGDAAGESFSVRLATEPSSEVTVTISGHSGTEVRLSETSLTFRTTDWETEQPVTVIAGEDDNAVNEAVTLDLAASGGGYDAVTAEVAVTVIDTDTPALTVSPTALDVDEADAAGESFSVRLATEPSSEVTVTISGHSGTEVRLSETSLTFRTTDWETEQPVTVTAGEDDNAVNEAVTLDLAASGGGYDAVTAEVAVTVIDTDTPALTVSPTALDVDEADAAGESFSVRLATEPSSEVTVTISGHSGTEVRLSETSLTFKTTDWETEQPVTVTAGEDDNAVNEAVTLDLAASGGGYDAVTAKVAVTVIDNDEPYSLSIANAGAIESAGHAVFTVTLSGQSTSVVTVNYATSDGTAEAGSDYAASSGALSIPVGSTTAEIRVPILDDTEDEANETFTVLAQRSCGGQPGGRGGHGHDSG